MHILLAKHTVAAKETCILDVTSRYRMLLGRKLDCKTDIFAGLDIGLKLVCAQLLLCKWKSC